MTEKIIPDGYKLVAVKGLDELVYWLERCKDKGHLENCADLIEPFEAFEYRNVSEEAVIAAHEAKAAPAQEVGGSVQLRGLDDSSAMLRVRTILESRACYLAGSTIAEIVDAAKPDAPAVPDVMSILRAIHRRPSDAGIWLDDITRILRDAPAPAVPQGEPVDFDSIIADIEAIDCVYRGDPSYDYDPRDIREQAANVVRHHATHYVTPAAPSQPVTLTDEEINRSIYEHTKLNPNQAYDAELLAGIRAAIRAIIAALRKKEQTK